MRGWVKMYGRNKRRVIASAVAYVDEQRLKLLNSSVQKHYEVDMLYFY